MRFYIPDIREKHGCTDGDACSCFPVGCDLPPRFVHPTTRLETAYLMRSVVSVEHLVKFTLACGHVVIGAASKQKIAKILRTPVGCKECMRDIHAPGDRREGLMSAGDGFCPNCELEMIGCAHCGEWYCKERRCIYGTKHIHTIEDLEEE